MKRERSGPVHPAPSVVMRHGTSDSEIVWEDPELSRDLKIRRYVQMSAVTTMKEDGQEATADVSIAFAEGAEFWDERGAAWQAMDEAQFNRWISTTGYLRREYSTTASITKRLDQFSNEPVIVSQSACGTSKDDPQKDWTMAENGIGIRLDWREDELIVQWESPGIGVEQTEQAVSIPFSSRFSSPQMVDD